MQPESDNIKRFQEDLPAFVRGQLSPALEQEIRSAAETDPQLAKAIREEIQLDSFLGSLMVPEISSDFRQRFWKRFYTDNARMPWLRLAGPIAAVLVLSLGVYLFVYGNEDPKPATPIADIKEPTPEDKTPNAKEVTPAVEEIDFSFISDQPDDNKRKFSLEELELLKQLNSSEFVHLDKVENSGDIALVGNLSLLLEIDEEDGQ
ncbi:MAG: hypothetical protein V3V10_07335 [Planctomycetota bacterium]